MFGYSREHYTPSQISEIKTNFKGWSGSTKEFDREYGQKFNRSPNCIAVLRSKIGATAWRKKPCKRVEIKTVLKERKQFNYCPECGYELK